MKYLFLVCTLASATCFGNQAIAENLRIIQLREQFNERIRLKFTGIDPSDPEQVAPILEEEIDILEGLQMPLEDIRVLRAQLSQCQMMIALREFSNQNN